MVTVLRTDLDRFGQVWTSQSRCEVLFFLNRESHALQIWPTPKTCVQFSNCTSLKTLWPSEVVESVLRHASVGVRCELVWSATFLQPTFTNCTSLESSRLAKFECAISSGYDVRQQSYGLQYFWHKRCLYSLAWDNHKKEWITTFLGRNLTSRTSLESSRSWKLKYAFLAGWAKR